MTAGQKEYAIRQGLNRMDLWRDATNRLPRFSTYYYEFGGVATEAVIIGIRSKLGLKIRFDDCDQIIDDEEDGGTFQTHDEMQQKAIDVAIDRLENWVDCIGWIDVHESAYSSMEDTIRDCVLVGIRVAEGYAIRFNLDGALIRDKKKDFGSRGEEQK